ncbi:MAG TPA: TadE/TadG family type IV pilus assembly protein [Pyrinomonadaceae bacterium]|nr:TadE/TadG family type IV pilus assembly protein [Pyrinomonadaceae bacterium]
MLPKTFPNKPDNERGGSLIEFTVVASVFFLMLVGIVAAGNLYYTHNALVEATRRGARYAVLNPTGSTAAVQNVVIYGTPTPAEGATSLVYNLQPANVTVTYTGLGVAAGTVTVSITGYTFPFVLPTSTTSVAMPPYRTTLTGESVGFVPPNIP